MYKGIENRLSISSITDLTEFMKIFDKLWVSTTNGSKNFLLSGTHTVINEMREKKIIEYCWKIGQKLFN